MILPNYEGATTHMGLMLVSTVFLLYLFGGYILIRRIGPRWGKLSVLVIMILIPTADAVYGRLELKQLCASEGGLKVFKVEKNVSGFYEPFGPNEERIKRFGFEYSEGPSRANRGMVDRFNLGPLGSLITEKGVSRKSDYQLRLLDGDLSDVYRKSGFVMESIDGRETLGRVIYITFAGGWMERAISGLYASRGNAGTCNLRTSDLESDALVSATLKPPKVH